MLVLSWFTFTSTTGIFRQFGPLLSWQSVWHGKCCHLFCLVGCLQLVGFCFEQLPSSCTFWNLRWQSCAHSACLTSTALAFTFNWFIALRFVSTGWNDEPQSVENQGKTTVSMAHHGFWLRVDRPHLEMISATPVRRSKFSSPRFPNACSWTSEAVCSLYP